MDNIINGQVVRVFAHDTDLFKQAAQDFAQRAMKSVAAKGEFNVALSGGTTAQLLFDALVTEENRQRIPWRQIKFFFGDERYVPSDDPQSNYHSAQQHLFSKVEVLSKNIYRIPTEFPDPHDCALEYAKIIAPIHFDLIYLGLGEDAHTASLMPMSEVVEAYCTNVSAHSLPEVVALWAPSFNMYRITLTPNAINRSVSICFLVTGKNKADAIACTLGGDFNPRRYPAQLIRADKRVIWLLDTAASAKLNLKWPKDAV